MITISGNIPTIGPLPAASSGTLSSSPSISSFASQLTSAIEQMVGNSNTGSRIEIDLSTVPGQNSDGRQISVVLKDVSLPVATQPATTQPAAAQLDSLPEAVVPFFQSVITGSTRTPAAFADTVDGAAALAPKKPLTAAQAYWAMQPPEVQALQNEPDPVSRVAQATKLAEQGFAIDVPIMVWGWNPLTTMQIRQADGYTWVPSGLQQPIAATPGFQVAGFANYDPNSPPPGSIKVTTDFAKGTLDDPARSSSAGAVTS
jgi:hypothetical protein